MQDPNTLPFTARTSSGEVRELLLRLHPHTRCSEHVGELVEAILAAVSEVVELHGDVGDGDLIQALTLAAGIRLNVARVPPDTAQQLMTELTALALRSASDAVSDSTRAH